MLDSTVFDYEARALTKVRRDEYYRRARKGEKKELYCFAHLIFCLERDCDDLEDDEDIDRVVIPQSVTPEMLIDAKERIALAAKRLAAFAARIDERLIEAQARRAA